MMPVWQFAKFVQLGSSIYISTEPPPSRTRTSPPTGTKEPTSPALVTFLERLYATVGDNVPQSIRNQVRLGELEIKQDRTDIAEKEYRMRKWPEGVALEDQNQDQDHGQGQGQNPDQR